MKKILDTSAISAMDRNIQCIDLMSILTSKYDVVITPSVIDECRDDKDSNPEYIVETINVMDDPRLNNISNIILSHYPMLGPGERASMAASLILTAKGIPNYVVLDDKKARTVANNIGNLNEIESILGKKLSLNVTGTIGIVLHFHDNGIISDKIKQDIGFDLEKSDFRISSDLLSLLR